MYAVAILTVLVVWMNDLNEDIALIHAKIYSHMSNFTISFVMYLGVWYRWLLQKAKFERIASLGLGILLSNVVSETLMGFMNTTDLLDAVYGILTVSMCFSFLFLPNVYGVEKG